MGPTPSGIQRPLLIDSTLRDGLQAPDVLLSDADALAIARALDAAGIDEIEAGIPAMGPQARARIAAIAAAVGRAQVSAWCRARMTDVTDCAGLGLDLIHISLPCSDRWLAGCRLDWDSLLRLVPMLVATAKRHAQAVALGAIDAARTPRSRLATIALFAQDLGVSRLRLADTVGLWTPEEAARSLRVFREVAPALPLGIHAHNDLGQAVAVTMAALSAGATWADATVLGLGERAGNCALEPLALALQLQCRRPAAIDLEALPALAKLVSRATARAIPPDQPVVGAQIFAHRSGIHVHQQQRDELACQPCHAATVGRAQDLPTLPIQERA